MVETPKPDLINPIKRRQFILLAIWLFELARMLTTLMFAIHFAFHFACPFSETSWNLTVLNSDGNCGVLHRPPIGSQTGHLFCVRDRRLTPLCARYTDWGVHSPRKGDPPQRVVLSVYADGRTDLDSLTHNTNTETTSLEGDNNNGLNRDPLT